MGTITLPNNPGTIQNTQVTDATKVMENFTAIVSEVNGNIDAVNLGALAVETAKIAALAVTAAKLATDAVETLKIKDANVTLAKMAANSVDSDQYVDGSIDKVHLAADIIDGTKIGDDVLDSEHYVAGSIDAEHLASDAVETAKIKNLNVTLAKMAVGSIALSKTGIKIGNSTRNASGDQIIAGVGFRSSAIIFIAIDNTGANLNWSAGFDDGTVAMCIYQNQTGAGISLATAQSMWIFRNAGASLESVVSVLGADGFTLTWTISGTCQVDFIYLCLP